MTARGKAGVLWTCPRCRRQVKTVFASVAVARRWLDLVFVLGRRLKHRRIKKAQQEYPGMVHFLRIDKVEDLDADLAAWLQEAYDHRKGKDQSDAGE